MVQPEPNNILQTRFRILDPKTGSFSFELRLPISKTLFSPSKSPRKGAADKARLNRHCLEKIFIVKRRFEARRV